MDEQKKNQEILPLQQPGKRTCIVNGEQSKIVEGYLMSMPEGWRRDKLLLLRQLLFECAFDLEESIEEGQLVYWKEGKGNVFRIFITAGYVSFTLERPIEEVDPCQEILGHLVTGRRSLRLRQFESVKEDQLRKFIQEAVYIWRQEQGIERP